MANPKGNRDALVPAPAGNTHGLQHGFYSKRIVGERASAIADGLMGLPFTQPLDRLAAEEIASVIASLGAIDRALSDGKVEVRGKVRGSLLTAKAALSRELRTWLREFGASPLARYEVAAKLGRPSLGEEIARRLAEVETTEANGAR
jgi:hypothetical protein